MNLHRTTGEVVQFPLAQIDSVTQVLTTSPQVMRTHLTNGGAFLYPLQEIDSITYSASSALGSPHVWTLAPTGLGTTSCVVGGAVTGQGTSSTIARGICFGTNTTPSLSNDVVTAGTGIGDFQVVLTGLSPGTQYYARAYATNSQGTSYGNVAAFRTYDAVQGGELPTVVSVQPQGTDSYSSQAGGSVASDGGSTVFAKGVCWDTGLNPTINDAFTVDGAGLGAFTSTMTALQANTTYNVRAFATNANGTAYGGAYQITTAGPLQAAVNTLAVGGVATTSAMAVGEILHQGGATVTLRGFCWSTQMEPTLALNEGSYSTPGGIGSFIGQLADLEPNTTYYVRAFATNSQGTSYGYSRVFTTSGEPCPALNGVDEDFSSGAVNTNLELDCWINTPQSGDRRWRGATDQGNSTAKATSFSSMNATDIIWLITPVQNFTPGMKLSFRSRREFGVPGHQPLSVLLSTDLPTGQITSATWIPVPANIPTTSTQDQLWVASGLVDLGTILPAGYTGTFVIGFRYTGNAGMGQTTNISLDDVLIE